MKELIFSSGFKLVTERDPRSYVTVLYRMSGGRRVYMCEFSESELVSNEMAREKSILEILCDFQNESTLVDTEIKALTEQNAALRAQVEVLKRVIDSIAKPKTEEPK